MPGMERHEFAMEHFGIWGRQRLTNTTASNLEARCPHVQQVSGPIPSLFHSLTHSIFSQCGRRL